MTPALARKVRAGELGDEFKHRGTLYRIVECRGEAHSNPWIDHCSWCLPLRGRYAEPVRIGPRFQNGRF